MNRLARVGLLALAVSTAALAQLTITTSPSLPHGVVNVPYANVLGATGGTAPYSWQVVTLPNTGLPPGLSLSTGGSLLGSPTTAGTYSFRALVTDSQSKTATTDFTLIVDSLGISTPSPLSIAVVNSPYSHTLFAIGGTTPYVNWTVISGSLPNGLTLNPSTGEISGVATIPGSSTFTVRVQDSSAPQLTATKSLTLPVVSGPLTITTPSPLPPGTQNGAYSFSLAATGGTAPYTNWIITSGALPAGLSLNASTGAITGARRPSAGRTSSCKWGTQARLASLRRRRCR